MGASTGVEDTGLTAEELIVQGFILEGIQRQRLIVEGIEGERLIIQNLVRASIKN